MTEEIKEILDYIDDRIIPNEKWDKIKDYITKLQQNLDKANDIIKKDRQFYKCRMGEYVELKKENEFLKLNNPEMNIEHFRIVKENKRKIDNLRKENEKLKENLCKNIVYERWYIHYKSRFEKTIEYINFVINHYKEQLETPIEDTYFNSDVNRKGYILSIIAYLQATLDTLIGSDENETK